MTVYVDEIFTTIPKGSQARKAGNKWCHMWADDIQELHTLASSIGLNKDWFQEHKILPHYDLTPTKRQKALDKGAVSVSRKELGNILRQRRLEQ